MTPKKVIRALKKEGWYEVSQKGSHLKMRKGNTNVIIPIHTNKDLKLGTLKSIEKTTGVKLQ